MANPEIDLSRLALDRSPPDEPVRPVSRRRRKWIARYLIPGGILVGFAALIIAAAGTQLMPRQSVQVVPVIVQRSAVQQAGTPLFQAAGWIEPRPTSINVPALAPGVIEELLVVEGQAVEKGEPIARLISIDAQIAVKEAKAAIATAQGELDRALAEQQAARIRLDQPVHLQIQLAEAKSALARAEIELANLPFQIESAEADLTFAQQSLKGKQEAGDAIRAVLLRQAESELAVADAKLRELKTRGPGLQREIDALRDKATATESQLKLLVEEKRQLAQADAGVQSATALRNAATLQLKKAGLVLKRNTIRAPDDGRILRLVASPGMRVMGMAAHAGQSSSTVVEMYDPLRLQIRADVRLEDVPLIQPGQPVEIETASSGKTILGRVLQPTSTANIQKNTLEVKVELIDPPNTVRPEMLVTATFLAPETSATDEIEETVAERIFVPRQLVQSGESANAVWIVDADSRARKVSVSLGRATSGELVEVTSGLTVTDKLITSDTGSLRDGSLVDVTGEDRDMGR
ncbi:MAG: efflux RND transporter periplasmic adaptor subunit [Pirellulaceae bacterium]